MYRQKESTVEEKFKKKKEEKIVRNAIKFQIKKRLFGAAKKKVKELAWPKCSIVQRNLTERIPEMGIKQEPVKEKENEVCRSQDQILMPNSW